MALLLLGVVEVAAQEDVERLLAAGKKAEAAAVLRERGEAAIQARQYGEAVGLLERAVELEPSAAGEALLGRALALDRRFAEGARHLRRAVELGDPRAGTRLYLGAALWEAGEVGEAERVFREVVEATDGAVQALQQLGRLLLWRGRHEEALPLLERAARLAPDAVELLWDLARAYQEGGRLKEAVGVYRRLVTLAPELAQARYALGLLLQRMGDAEGAQRELAEYGRLLAEEKEATRRRGLERAREDQGRRPSREGEPGVFRSLEDAAAAQAARAGTPLSCRLVVLREVAAASGIDFRHRSGASPAKHLPETMGAGLAWLDYDGDGWLDLYLVQSGSFPPAGGAEAGNRLFRNRGADASGRARFEAVAGDAGAGDRGYGQGALAVDLDGDGDTDLLVTNFGRDALLWNRGDGSFEAAGLPGAPEGWSTSAAAADGDGDGDLDLYVARYVEYDPQEPIFCGDAESGRREYCDPSLFLGAPDLYFENRGAGAAGGRPAFAERAREAGLTDPQGKGLGVLFSDLDADRRPEVYVANDQTVNLLFRNAGGGRFEDVSLVSGTAVNRDGLAEAGMGLALGDADGDGDPDLAVTNFDFETNTFYRNLGGLAFEDDSAETGFGPPALNLLGFGIAAADLDLDGDLDYYVANGHVFEHPPRKSATYEQPSLVLAGDGRGRFTAETCPVYGERPGLGRGLAAADYDNDGDPDLAAQNNDRPLALLENAARTGRWVGVALRGEGGNRDGIGAVVRLRTSAGTQTRWVVAGDSYLSSSDKRVLFALPVGAAAEALEIEWPSGRRQRLLAPPLGSYLTLFEP